LGQESSTFIQNVTQLAKEGFDSPQNAKLFLQLDSIALNASSSHPGNVTLTAPTSFFMMIRASVVDKHRGKVKAAEVRFVLILMIYLAG